MIQAHSGAEKECYLTAGRKGEYVINFDDYSVFEKLSLFRVFCI